MILVKLMGGLGNQLFQYATARRLSLTLGVPLKLDTSDYQHQALRVYELEKFQIAATLATPWELVRFRGLKDLGGTTYVKERSFGFDPSVLALKDSCYLDGYWQSYRYFEDQAAMICQELTVKSAVSGRNSELLEHLHNAETISLHVRRGDYVSDTRTNQYHGTCSVDYYQQAVEALRATVRQPELCIFSDDMPWVREHLIFDLPTTYVDWNAASSVQEDLRLMMACKHFVIANSSLSWWGAWLAPHATKNVYAPKQWFADPTKDTSDLIPPSWLRI